MKETAVSKAKYLKVSPRKMLGVCNLVRGKDVLVAKSILMRTPKKGATLINKALDSAVANAKNKNMNDKALYIEKITADVGPTLSRFIPWSRGTARPIKKRMTHLTVVLQEREGVGKKAKDEDKKEEKVAEKKEKVISSKKTKDNMTVTVKVKKADSKSEDVVEKEEKSEESVKEPVKEDNKEGNDNQ